MRHKSLLAAIALVAPIPSAGQIRQPEALGEARYITLGDQEVTAFVDTVSGVPAWIPVVDHLALDPGSPGVLESEGDVARAVEAFLVAHSDALRVDVSTLGEPLIRSHGDLWFISYGQRLGGTDTWDTRVAMTITRSGYVLTFGAKTVSSDAGSNTPAGDDTPTPNPVDPEDLEGAAAGTVSGDAPVRLPRTIGVSPVESGTGTVSGRVTQNFYRTQDDYSLAMERVIGAGFRGARVNLLSPDGSETVFADQEGRFEFSGLPSPGSYILQFVMENDRARIASGVPDSSLVHETPFSLEIAGERIVRNMDWGWGDGGDTLRSATSSALTALYHVRLMDDRLKMLGFDDMAARARMDIEILSEGSCGAHTFPADHRINLCHPFAMSGEVVMHEYAHNVIFALSGNREVHRRRFGGDPDFDLREAWALDEGFADYLACAVTDNYTFGGPGKDFGDPAFPSGTGITIRFLFNDLTADDFIPSFYYDNVNGVVIAGSVWKVRADQWSDPEVVDRILLLALRMEPWAQSVGQLTRNLFAADRYLTGGRYGQSIERKLVERGLRPPAEPAGFSYTITNHDLVLTWDDRSDMEDGYEVQRRDPGSGWYSVGQVLQPNSTEAILPGDECVSGAAVPEYRVRVFESAFGLESFSPFRAVDPCLSGVAIEDTPPSVPASDTPELAPAYPNPASSSVTLSYSLPSHTRVRIVLFDALGRRVAVLEEADREPGSHSVSADLSTIPPGMYGIVMTTNSRTLSRLLTVVR